MASKGRPSKHSKEVWDEVVQLRKDGKSCKEIEKMTGISANGVKAWCHRQGLLLNPEQFAKLKAQGRTVKYPEEALKKAFEMKCQGLAMADIKLETRVTPAALDLYCKKNRLEIPTEAKEKQIERRGLGTKRKALERSGFATHIEKYDHYAKLKGGTFVGPYGIANAPANFTCDKNHVFQAFPTRVLANRTWCPMCDSSSAQQEIYTYVKGMCPDTTLNDRKTLKGKELDILVPSAKFALEFNGLYWHSSYMANFKRNDSRNKAKMATDAGLKFFMVYEDEWQNRKALVKAMIKSRLGKFDGQKVFARKCALVFLDKNKAFQTFFEENHLDGHTKASWAFGLTFEGTLVMVASVRMSRDKTKRWELARLATKIDYMVVGGAGKLVKAIKQCINNAPLMTYSNNRLSTGNVYQKLGFTEITITNRPSYYYTDFKVRIWREKCKRVNMPEILAKYPTEELQALNGIFSQKLGHNKPMYRIEDCGHRKWVL